MLAILGVFSSLFAQTPITAGYRDFYFTKSANSTPTGEKPQSKLWWNDGIWWGSLWDPGPKTHTIHRFNLATQSWTSTGTAIDSRPNAKADALWDGQRLYIVSQVFTHSPGPTTPSNGGLLYRYSYHSASKSYSLDAGFPVSVNSSISETLVLAKDSTGKLWVTWTEGGKVKVNRSVGDDLTWGTPFDLPVQGTDTKIDDISSVLAFGGNKIGIMWSNQNDKTTYFAVHQDGNADETWAPKEQALYDPALGQISYDHFNLKPSCDNEGNVYAVARTSLSSSSAPYLYVLKRNAAGVWTRYLAGLVSDGHTRPILLIDGEHRKLYVFAMSEAGGAGAIYMKSSDLDNIDFASGLGTPFIQSATDTVISNPTSTKQCLNSATGLLVLASDQRTRYYFHNYLDLSGGAASYTMTVNTSGSGNVTLDPPGGVYDAGTNVTLTATPGSGYQFSGWSDDLTGSTNPATITMDVNKNVTATFTALPPQYTLTVNTTGSGSVTLNPPGGVYNAGTNVILTATPSSGYQFSGWSDDLTGSTNPATITMDTAKNITAAFTALPANSPIFCKETRSGRAVNSTTVTTSANLAGVSGHLYLAAISMRPKVKVVSLSGLGLEWTLVRAKCAGRNTTGVEVWMAQGTSTGKGVVTATLASAPQTAVIAVSRYAGVDPANPIGNVIAGNANGLNGQGACSGGVDQSSYSFDLNAGVDQARVYGAVAIKARTHSPGEGYTERAEVRELNSTQPSGVAVQDKTVAAAGTVTVNGSFGGVVDWAFVGLEIRPQLSAGKRALTEQAGEPPAAFQLEPNYPNPFNPGTLIGFSLSEAGKVTIKVYNETGQLVRKLVDNEMAAGRHTAPWDGRNQLGSTVAAGVYLYQMLVRRQDGQVVFMQTRRMTLLK
ncbi:MAG: InlB B-repeat-containing protein [candidate division KSB1 bacterium]|nr:InlB B-repeat-containing protein [candidate division KSB1 bacterium]MDZ7364301.1 InlB B-repeat-containing protein [candidate division KSB1 bacterium]MDZ7405024.1 InlB B-repeat-containing protein [candidate division KSB1 bacterium]